MKKKIQEMLTNDTLAIVAAKLALKSKYLQDNHDLFQAFWYFFDSLVRDRDARRKAGLWEKELEEMKEERLKKLEEIKPLIDEVLAGLKGKVSHYAYNAVGRAFQWDGLTQHPKEVDDRTLLQCRRIGRKTLAAIRLVYPYAEPKQ